MCQVGSRKSEVGSRRAAHAASLFPTHDFRLPISNDLLVWFRIVFGGVMLYWAITYSASGLVDALYIEPRFHFHYLGFDWVRPWPGEWMRVHFYVLGLCAALVALGCFYRVAALVFAIGFTHVFLIDKCLYQNHYYLICLVSWIMVLLPAHRAFSLDAWRHPATRSLVAPAWTLWLVRFQIGVPYFFGGLAKLNADWLAGQPMRTMLAERTWVPGLGQFFTQEWCVQMFVWGGLLFDLLVVPALLWRRTRVVALVTAIAFHLVNASLFTIGIFPWFMMLATVVFLPPGSLRQLLVRCHSLILGSVPIDSRFGSVPLAVPVTSVALAVPVLSLRQPARDRTGRASATLIQYGATLMQHGRLSWSDSSAPHKLLAVLLGTYVALQIAIPLRHYLQDGNPSWTEEGHYFAWHMLLRGKYPAVRFYATEPRTGRTGAVDLRRYVTPHQMRRFARDPRMIHEMSQIIAADLRSLGFRDVQVRVLALVSMNGRKPQLMIDPTVDLAAEPRHWKRPGWIVPLTEPLRERPWDVPLEEWERHVEIPLQYRRPEASLTNTKTPNPKPKSQVPSKS